MKKFGLSKIERIKSKNEFEIVFSEGKTIYTNSRKLKAIFYVSTVSRERAVKAAFAVHKKAGNAVWRNRAKRLLREAYRLNKHLVIIEKKNYSALIVFSLNKINKSNSPILALSNVSDEIVELLNSIRNEIELKD